MYRLRGVPHLLLCHCIACAVLHWPPARLHPHVYIYPRLRGFSYLLVSPARNHFSCAVCTALITYIYLYSPPARISPLCYLTRYLWYLIACACYSYSAFRLRGLPHSCGCILFACAGSRICFSILHFQFFIFV